jgi:uncharacterized protein (TIGR02001 family)
MFKARVFLVVAALAAASAAQAGVTVTPTVVSDYDFRGLSQSATQPALQVGVDYAGGPFHVGAWASNIEWGTAYKGTTEVDILADYTVGSDDTAKFNFGAIDYMYPRMTDQNTVEVWGTVSKKWFSGSARYSNDWFNLGIAMYLEANGTFPIGESGFNVTAHIGRSFSDAWKGIEYTDMALGVTKGLGNFTVGLKVVSDAGTRAFDNTYKLTASQQKAAFGKKGVFSADDRVLLSISTTLPWAK